MKLSKSLLLLSSMMLLASCGGSESKSSASSSSIEVSTTSQAASSSEESKTSVSSEETTTSTETATSSEEEATTVVASSEEEKIEIKKVAIDYSSFEEHDGVPVVYINTDYVVKVYAYGEDETTPLDSDQIEYEVTARDGSDEIKGVKVNPGEAANEFILRAYPGALELVQFDLRGGARVKGDTSFLTIGAPDRILIEDPNAEW